MRHPDSHLSSAELHQLKNIVQEIRRRKNLPRIVSGVRNPAGELFYDPLRDGVTYSALEVFRRCKEMSRLNLRGITSRATSTSMVFGQIAHGALQTVYDAVRTKRLRPGVPSPEYVKRVLELTEGVWKRENPRASSETMQHLEYSMLLAHATLPKYFNYWSGDFTGKIKWLALEKEFKIPVAVPVTWQAKPFKTFLRGKMDGNFRQDGLRLFETKTKSHIDDETISAILPYELQVHIYMWAMRRMHRELPSGVRYNLIRRPQLRQSKKETLHQFAMRCADDVKKRPDWYYMRLDMDVSRHDLDAFEGELMDLLADFLGWWYGHEGHYRNSGQCENKYGKCHFLPICGRKEFATFYRRDTVFRELEEF